MRLRRKELAGAAEPGAAALTTTPVLKRPPTKVLKKGKQNAAVGHRVGSRHRLYPCCGKCKVSCRYNYTQLRDTSNQDAFLYFINYLGTATLLTMNDTVDTGVFLSSVDLQHLSMSMAFRYCLVFRRFNNHSTWSALMPFITSAQVNWQGIRKALQQIRGSGEKMFGGLFYPATLRRYRMLPQRRWRACKGMSVPVRETLFPSLVVVGDPIEGVR